MKNLAFALLALSGVASADSLITFPGSAGQPAAENEPTNSYQCFNDGHRIASNSFGGYSRCRAVFPLTYEGAAGVLSVKANHSSADKTSYIKMELFKVTGHTSVSYELVSDLSSSANVEETLTALDLEPMLPGQSIYAVIEVRGDTALHSVVFDVMPL